MAVPIQEVNALLENTTIGELIELAVRQNGGELVAHPNNHNVFREEGDSWTLSFVGHSVNVKPRVGLNYIAHLLANPSQRIPVMALYFGVNGGSSTAGQARPPAAWAAVRLGAGGSRTTGVLADSPALREYHRRLDEMKDEIQHAQDQNDEARVLSLEREREKILRFLHASTNHKGSLKRFDGAREKARKCVSNAISRAISKISEKHIALGQHLRNSVSTGYAAAYDPDEETQWQL